MIHSCLLTGVGGQGIEFLSRIMGDAAIASGLEIRGWETIGITLQGGSVVSHVRLGQNIYSPLIPRGKAGLVIALDLAEAVRVHSFLSPTGRMLALDRAIMPASSEEKYDAGQMLSFLEAFFSHPSEERASQKGGGEWLTVLKSEDLIKKCGSSEVLNMALLGAAVGKNFLPIKAEDVLAALRKRLPADSLEIHVRAFNAGRGLAG